jgi:hypothetical protein
MVTFSNDHEDDRIRLADDVFSKICIMINDISLEVKVCAASLLVTFLFFVLHKPKPETNRVTKHVIREK